MRLQALVRGCQARAHVAKFIEAMAPPIVHTMSGSFNMTEYDAEEFRLAFEGKETTDFYAEVDRIWMNDPAQTSLHVGGGLADDAARLLGRYIATNEHLSQLRIFNDVDAADSLFEGLRGSRSLTYLGIATRLSSQEVQSILPFLMNAPKLKALRLNLGHASFRAIIRTLRSIESLSLTDSDIGDVSAICPCNLPNLECLDLDSSGIISVPSLHGFPELTALSLYGNKIGKEGFASLNEYLASDSCQLDSLNLGDTGMADDDISSLTRALKHNRSVEEVCLRGNDCGEAGYRSILKMLLDISSIKATIQSNTCLLIIDLHKENDTRDDYDSDSDASEYNPRDGFEEIREWIYSVLECTTYRMSLKERIKWSHLRTWIRRQLCEMQGVDYSYDSLFAEIPPCILPELFSLMWTDPGMMDPFRALVATVASWTSLVDRRLMVETTLERNRAQVEQLNDTVKQMT